MVNITEIQGTDYIGAARIIINSNFKTLKDEINLLETFIDPVANSINISNANFTNLQVGTNINTYLSINASGAFDINTNVTLHPNNNFIIDGDLIYNNQQYIQTNLLTINSSNIIDITNFNPVNENVIGIIDDNTTTTPYIISITLDYINFPVGKEITIYYENSIKSSLNPIQIQLIDTSTSTRYILSDVAFNYIKLNNIGSSVILKKILTSGGQPVFVIKGGNLYNII